MKKIAIIGASGFVGSALSRQGKDKFDITSVTRKNFLECKNKQYDIVINSAMPSRRFWALNNPVSDVMESVVKTAEIFYEWKYDKFIQISSISAQIQTDIPYGAHKKAAEVIVENNKDAMIVRLGALYGEGLTKSALFDLVNHNHIYVDIRSEYNYIDVDCAANWIFNNLEKTGIREVGAYDTVSLLELSAGIWDKPTYEGRFEKIHTDNVEYGMPSAKKVLNYINLLKKG
tara:strand:- start:199 stop:891 length:693 start_codon:yes stop_codon:yes gene_type:complete